MNNNANNAALEANVADAEEALNAAKKEYYNAVDYGADEETIELREHEMHLAFCDWQDAFRATYE